MVWNSWFGVAEREVEHTASTLRRSRTKCVIPAAAPVNTVITVID